MEEKHQSKNRTGLEIAVIGMAGRFPGANSVGQFWDSILQKKETISLFSKQELRDEGIPGELLENANYVRAAGIIENKEYFDPYFFGYSPNEARLLDPQLRIFHECAWESLENAGCNPFTFDGKIGLYAGCSPNFGWELLVRESGLRDVLGDYSASLFSDKDALTQHISYRLNLRGPSVNIQTACSTSLVAVHMACQGLLSGDCDMALAGGVSASCLRKSGYLYQDGMIMSPDGHCRAFDAKAAGTVFGEGAGVVVLKPLTAALNDGDHIYAIIRSSAVNNDGREKVGFTATSLNAQVDLIRTAHQAAGIDAADITFIETHGTATPLGDPIEIEALRRAFDSRKNGGCAIGSVKTNVGHLNRAAGIAGLIKAVMALHERVLPPHLHFTQSNPEIDFGKTPFVVNTEATVLKQQAPIFAGVSSFGLGGTNAHVVLEEPPTREEGRVEDSPQLILLSAKSACALEEMTGRLTEFIRTAPKPPALADVAHTLQQGRAEFDFRRMMVAASTGEFLENANRGKFLDRKESAVAGPVVFMFPGQGAQYRNMGRDIYTRFPEFRRAADECFEIFRDTVAWDIKPYLYPEDDRTPSKAALTDMRILQPAIFIFQYALAKFLIQAGVQPYAMIGYSFGEYVAACLAGVFSLEDAISLTAFRGELMQSLPEGEMLSVPLSEEAAAPLLHSDLSLAAVNGPACILSGSPAAIRDLELRMQDRGLLCMPVQTRYAGHAQMPPHLKATLEERIRSMRLAPPATPYISSLTGTWIKPQEAMSAAYWVEHMTSPIRFCQGIAQLTAQPRSLFLEVGAGRDLTLLVSRLLNQDLNQKSMNLIPPGDQENVDDAFFLKQMGRLWLQGQPLRWNQMFSHENARKTPLPAYPFQRQAYWPSTDVYESYSRLISSATAAKRLPMEKWGHASSWKRASLAVNRQPAVSSLELAVIFMDEGNLGQRLAQVLAENGNRVISVRKGMTFSSSGLDEFIINPEAHGDYFEVFKSLAWNGAGAVNVFHLWNVSNTGVQGRREWTGFVREQYNGYFSLLFIARSLGKLDIGNAVGLYVISTDLQNVTGNERTCVEKAPLLGAVQVIPKEYPNISCRSVDISGADDNGQVGCILAELSIRDPVNEVAYRGASRWVRAYTSIPLSPASKTVGKLRPAAAYLITGGLGDMGLVLAKSLAERHPVKLLLTGQSFFPPKSEWNHWLETKGSADPVGRKIIQLQAMEFLGSTVWAGQVDCSDHAAMKTFLDAHRNEAGEIRGIIHAAGVIDGTLIQRRSVDRCLAVMKPKIQGLYVLERLFQLDALDFFVTYSSVSSVIPSAGQVAYCASNLFLDRWAIENALFENVQSKSIGWDIWSEVGMGERAYRQMKEAGQVAALVKAKELALQDGIRNQEGMEIFHQILEQAEPHVIVSTKELEYALDVRDQGAKVPPQADWLPPQEKLASRPELCAPYLAPETESEKRICNIWQTYFGIGEIGIHDDFFELGGDSLKAGVVLNRIHEELNVTISLAAFYENSRVDRLAALVDTSHKTLHAPIYRVAPADHYEMSHAQLRLWFLNEFDASGFAYNRSSILKLKGAFDLTLYRRCFQTLMERHEGLRTSFIVENGVPQQKIHADLPFPLIEDDLTVSTNRKDDIQALVQEELRFGFDLSKPPLFRARVLKTAADEFISIFTIHHIVCDERSIHILHKELSFLYNSHFREQGGLTALSIQYKDYVAWSNRLASSEEHRAFWLDYLSGELPRTVISADKVRPSGKTYRGKVISGAFPPDVSAYLNGLKRGGNASLFMVLTALVEVLIYRYTGDEDILIGTAVAGRDHVQLEGQIGFFVNTLPLRYLIQGDLTFQELLARTRKTTLTAYEHQAYPFDKIVEDLKLKRDPSWNPLFEIMILFHPDHEPDPVFHDLEAEPMTFPSHSSLFDLTFNFQPDSDGIHFSVEYNPDLYSDEKVRQIGVHLVCLAQSLSCHPGQALKSLALMPAEEERRLILSRNVAAPEIPPDATLGKWFEQCVERQPGNVAVVCNGTVLTYRELNERVNQVAHYLTTCFQPAPDRCIGVCLDRSEELVIAILAVLKTGCAYVPIDPTYPESRIQYILQDSRAIALLIDGRNERLLQISPDLPVVSVGQARSSVRSNLPATAQSHHLAYVTYTSGSTGHPKGVMIEHRNVLNYLHNCTEILGICPGDTVYGLTSVTFDISVMELVCSLLIGAKLVLEHDVYNMETLAARIRDERVSVLQMTPSRLHAYIEKNSILTLSGVRVILVGGETLPSALLLELRKLEHTQVFHVYGPTETTIWSSADLISGQNISLGLPLAGEEIFILSGNSTLMPRGLPGEICIAGDGVGRGYLNQPELTARQFVNVPFLPGKRAYRTGDVGQISMDGELKYLGRSDSQIKIQGVRVETDEIEKQLLRHPSVGDAVVLARDKDGGGKALWACVISPAKETELRRYLAEVFPYYMVPEVFIFLRSLPLTVNGKTDRQALMRLDARSGRMPSCAKEPTPVEKQLAAIWVSVLKQPDPIGVRDNFFALGGNSLKAAQMITRIHSVFGVTLELRDIFTGPTIEEIAHLLEAVEWANSGNLERLPSAGDEFII